MSEQLTDVDQLTQALADLNGLVEFAYEQGFHEMGYDPLKVIREHVAALTTAAANDTPAMLAYEVAMMAAGVPHEPLEVYDSNSWRRVGLAGEYREVMYPSKDRDGHPNITGTDVLRALVAAFNVLIEQRAASTTEGTPK